MSTLCHCFLLFSAALPFYLHTSGFQTTLLGANGLPNHKAQKVQTSLSILTLDIGQNLPGSPGLVELTLVPQSLGVTPLTNAQRLPGGMAFVPGGKGKGSILTSHFPTSGTNTPKFSVHTHGTEIVLLPIPELCA